ncbi:MAG TPA: hypothetical protein VIJ64_01980 [Candidatus Lustribacter sp.]
MLLLACVTAFPARAARPLLDSGKWDNYFALFARNAGVPWKRITVRLDTYSGAAVDFAAYDVDPTDVLVAGANARPRAIDTSHRKAVAHWRFTPPPGLTFASNDVEVPLQNREGFYVIEARRGTAVQQVWVNLSRVGLITKESPGGSIVYGADLGTGRALRGMRVTYLVGTHFVYDRSDSHGISRVPAHAVFALAEWGKSRAFVSLFPQSPPPVAVLGVRADRASASAGESVRVVGFARRRSGNVYRPATGNVALTLVARGKTIASTHADLDRAGAFSANLDLPARAPAGDAAILASTPGASGGATIHIDGVGDTVLSIAAPCSTSCAPAAAIPLTLTAKRAGVPAPGQSVRVRIVRSPHVPPPEGGDAAPAWGVTTIVDTTLRTDSLGIARVAIPAPSDGLASTYGIVADSGPSTASANLVAPDARVALAVVPLHDNIDVSDPATFDIRGFDALDGTPASGLSVRVRISHGPTIQNATVTLGRDGSARVAFHAVALGMNLVTAQADVDGRQAIDVAAVTVASQALTGASASSGGDVKIALGRPRQRPGERTGISATLAGAAGDALITMESVRGVTPAVVPVQNGTASASLAVPETIGALAAGVAFVRDGAIVDASLPLVVDGPGHQRQLTLTSDRATYAPESTAKIAIADGDDHSNATLAVRVSDRLAAGGASFDDIPGVLSSAGTTTQNLASLDPPWHTWVAPAKSTAGNIFGFERPRQTASTETQIVAATTRVLTWRIARSDRSSFEVPMPREPGRYVLSVIKMTDDGDVGAASLKLTVQ